VNAQHCGASLTECTCRNVYDCHQNVTESQVTEYHKRVHTCTQTESGLATIYKACCTQVGPTHAAGGDGMDRWQHSSHLLLHVRRNWIPVTSTHRNH